MPDRSEKFPAYVKRPAGKVLAGITSLLELLPELHVNVLAAFSGLSLLLAGIGVHGLLSFGVSQHALPLREGKEVCSSPGLDYISVHLKSLKRGERVCGVFR